MKDLGNAIWSARRARGVTQEALAERLGITTSHLKHIESGHRKPSVEVLFELARGLDLSLDALIYEDDAQVPVLRMNGLTAEEVGAVARLVDLMRKRGRQE